MEQQNLPENTQLQLPTSTLAVVSLISGIVGIFFLPLIGGIVAIMTGNMARKETASFPPTASGNGMATAGMTLGWVSLLLWMIVCCVLASGLILGAWATM